MAAVLVEPAVLNGGMLFLLCAVFTLGFFPAFMRLVRRFPKFTAGGRCELARFFCYGMCRPAHFAGWGVGVSFTLAGRLRRTSASTESQDQAYRPDTRERSYAFHS